MESLIRKPNFEKGYSFFLTNDLGYLNEPSSNAGYKEFSIHDGRIGKNSSLEWMIQLVKVLEKERKIFMILK